MRVLGHLGAEKIMQITLANFMVANNDTKSKTAIFVGK